MEEATDGALSPELSQEMKSFLRAHRPTGESNADECLHPVGYWNLHGNRYPCLQFISVRLLAVCAPSAGGERCFKRVSALISNNRSSMSVVKATKQAQTIYNGGQLEESDAVDCFSRSKKEKGMRMAMAGEVAQPGVCVAHVGEEMAGLVLDGEGGRDDDPFLPDLEAEEIWRVVDAMFAIFH